MSEIKVKKDGLYKDGVKLQLVLGDPEQVAAIRKYERRIRQFEIGVHPTIHYEVRGKMYFACLCEENLFDRTVDADSEEDEECFNEEKFTCPKCKRTYEANYSRKTQNVKVFLKPFNNKNV